MMFKRFPRVAMLLGLTLAATACDDMKVTGPAPEAEAQAIASPEVQFAFETEASTAAARGDGERADALRDGIRALRFGVQPSEIEVKIKNETFTYKAIVVGRVYQRGDERILVRVLLAWDGNRPPAVLHVAQKEDKALFAKSPNGNSDVGGARGRWTNRAAQQTWMATSGSSDIELIGTGHACPSTTDLALNCVVATWDLRINGKFELLPDLNENLQIHTNSSGVIGVVLSRSE